MLNVLNIIAPVFILTLLGYLSIRFTWLTREQINGIGQFVIKIGLPAMTFHALTVRSFNESIQPNYLFAYATACLIGFSLAYFMAKKLGKTSAFAALSGLAFAMVNTAFVGIPILTMVIGSEKAGAFFAMNVLVEMVLAVPLTLILLEFAKNQQPNFKQTLKTIGLNFVRNNMMLGMFLGIICSLLNLPIPKFVHTCTSLLTQAASPLALFVIGASLYGLALRGKYNKLFWLVGIRAVIFIALVTGCLMIAGVEREMLFSGILLSAMPLPTIYALLGRQNGYETETAAITLASTLFSIIPITVILFLWV